MHVTRRRATKTYTEPGDTDPVRAAVRFPLQLPVQLFAGPVRFDATTIDVSSTGMLVVMDSVLHVGTELDWELLLPAEAMGSGADISVACHGRVVWVDEGTPHRIAVVIDQYRLKENAP